MSIHPRATCTHCGKSGRRAAHGWIATCYQRWLRAGRPASGPPDADAHDHSPHLSTLNAGSAEARAHRRARARDLRSQEWTIPQIAEEIGLKESTIRTYTAGMPLRKPRSVPQPEPNVPAPVTDAAPDDGDPVKLALREHRDWTRTIAADIAAGRRTKPPRGWDNQAACRGEDPDDWVPEYPRPLTEVREPCGWCPVAADCLTWALTNHEGYGFWASTTPDDRRILRRRIYQATKNAADQEAEDAVA